MLSNWTLIQIIFNLVTIATLSALWIRSKRPPQDDPRLSRGLQLLQTKITVLEDLSERTDNQVKQLSNLLDQKNRLLQNKILEAEQQILKIDHSMNKSMEVAEIFQDKIPHHEIVERQRTVEYVKAARMANSGLSVDEILKSVHLPREQVELIAKFNRDRLMFDEESLPAWANRESEMPSNKYSLSDLEFIGGMDTEQKPDLSQLERIESDFKAAVKTAVELNSMPAQTLLDSRVTDSLKASMASSMQTMASSMQSMQPAVMSMKATAQTFKEKLVATAEDLLKSPNPNITVKEAMAAQAAGKYGAAGASSYGPPPAQAYTSAPAQSYGSASAAATAAASTSMASHAGASAQEPNSRSAMTSGQSARLAQFAQAADIKMSQPAADPRQPQIKRVVFPRIEE